MKKYSTIAERNAMGTDAYRNTQEYYRLQQKCWEMGFSVNYWGEFRVNYNMGSEARMHTAQIVKSIPAVFKKIKEMQNSPRFNRNTCQYT